MGRALGDGANGIAPGERAHGARQTPPTEATSVLSAGSRSAGRSGARTAATSAVTPRRPRSGPPRRQPVAAQPAQAPAARAPRRRRSRLLVGLLALLVVAAAIVVVVVATSPAPTKVVLRNVVYSDVQQATSALKQLVSENTK
jgi:hypothetical protein